jgi:hypothetical protein
MPVQEESMRTLNRIVLGLVAIIFATTQALAQVDPPPSWNDGATKTSITDFVARVTTQSGICASARTHRRV